MGGVRLIPRISPEIHSEDFGSVFEFEIRNQRKELLDLSDALATEVIFMRPDGSSFSRPAQLLDSASSGSLPGTDGVMFYVIQQGDLSPAGTWFVQVFVALDGGAWSSTVSHFIVFPNLINLSGEVLTP